MRRRESSYCLRRVRTDVGHREPSNGDHVCNERRDLNDIAHHCRARLGAEKLSAGLALFGVVDALFVYKSVDWWRTVHPQTSVVPALMSSSSKMGPISSGVLGPEM